MSESRLNIRVSEDFLNRLREAADNRGVTLTAFVTTHMMEVLEGGEVMELKDEVKNLRVRLEKLEKHVALMPVG
jgi:uncharacterized protein (DUF1778 family)